MEVERKKYVPVQITRIGIETGKPVLTGSLTSVPVEISPVEVVSFEEESPFSDLSFE